MPLCGSSHFHSSANVWLWGLSYKRHCCFFLGLLDSSPFRWALWDEHIQVFLWRNPHWEELGLLSKSRHQFTTYARQPPWNWTNKMNNLLAHAPHPPIPQISSHWRKRALISLLEFEPVVPGSLSISHPQAENYQTFCSVCVCVCVYVHICRWGKGR